MRSETCQFQQIFAHRNTELLLLFTQQTFVLMKKSSRRLGQDQYVRLSLTSSEDVFKTSPRRLGQNQYICLSHTSSRRLQDVFKTLFQGVFKTLWRRLPKIIFKTFSRHQVKLFLLTGLWGVLNTFLRRSFPKTVIYRRIFLGNTTSEKFMVSVQNLL